LNYYYDKCARAFIVRTRYYGRPQWDRLRQRIESNIVMTDGRREKFEEKNMRENHIFVAKPIATKKTP
jgi:hypothetical protein